MSACYVILAHVTWALFIRAAKTVTWALTREWALARDTTVYDHRTQLASVGLAQARPNYSVQNGQTLEYDQEESCTRVATLKKREVGPGNEATLL